MTIILLVVGFILLIKGADFLVEGSSSIAKRFGISNLVIGLTVVAFGTSTPELIVNLISALQGNADIAIGNILGSNIANILLILGVSSIVLPLTVKSTTVWKEIPFALLAVLVIGVMANDMFFDATSSSFITRSEGLILLSFFAVFMYYILSIARNKNNKEDQGGVKKMSSTKAIFFILLGLGALVLGGKWVVDSAVTIATLLGMSQAVIGLTIVAIGTSLPELVTSVVAATKGKADIAIGNVVGSNIFNIFWILGITSIISPLPFNSASNIDIFATIFASLLLFIWMFVGSKYKIDRWQGVAFVMFYAFYLYLLLTIR